MSKNLKEKIEKNKKKLYSTNDKYKIFTKELLEFLGDDFIRAPASTMKSLHNAFPGGLIDHIILTTKYGVDINLSLPENIRVDNSSLIKVCFLHQIGKTFLYKLCESEWHRNNQGKMYEFKDDIVSMRVGERSAYYSLKYGVQLSEEEYQSIINYDKPDDDKQSKWYSTTLATILKQANELAIIEEKTLNNG
jgi:hypothetical protein|tara:strand:+ start:1898 stop:2473 length:576 start_codon:yes stop_codon:yes gene_type:complete